MRKYNIHLPLNYLDGRPIEQEKIRRVRDELVATFGSFAVPHRRAWRFEGTKHIEITKIEVVTTERIAKKRLTNLKRFLEEYLRPSDILITTQRIQTL